MCGALSGRDPQGDLVPYPGHTNLVVEFPELTSKQRFPDDLVSPLSHMLGEPGLGCDTLKSFIRLGPFKDERPEADSYPI